MADSPMRKLLRTQFGLKTIKIGAIRIRTRDLNHAELARRHAKIARYQLRHSPLLMNGRLKKIYINKIKQRKRGASIPKSRPAFPRGLSLLFVLRAEMSPLNSTIIRSIVFPFGTFVQLLLDSAMQLL